MYEVVFITRQDITHSQVDAISQKLSDVIKEKNGEVIAKEYWGFRTLAYSIKKNNKGHYVMLVVKCDGPAIHELERIMRYNEDLIRFMSIKINEYDEAGSCFKISNDAKSVNKEEAIAANE